MTCNRDLEQHFRELLAGDCDRPHKVKDYAKALSLDPAISP